MNREDHGTAMSEPTEDRELRLAVITGAVSGIGASLAELLVSRGWRLVLLNRSAARTKPLLERLRTIDSAGSVRVIQIDVTERPGLRAVADQITEEFGAVDALFNTAGVLREDLVLSQNGNELHFEESTMAPYLLARALRPALRHAAATRGRAVVVTPSTSAVKSQKSLDISALRTGVKGGLAGAYAQSKLAFAVLNAHLAAEYGDDGIEYFAVDPGVNRTAMTTSSAAPLPVRLMWRLLPKPSVGAARLAAMLDDEWHGRSGSLILGGRQRAIPGHAGASPVTEALLGVVEEAGGESALEQGSQEGAQ